MTSCRLPSLQPDCLRATALAVLALFLGLSGAARSASLPTDLVPGPTSLTLKTPYAKHWVWVNDFVFPHMADGQAYLIDADSGRYLGTLSTGYSFARIVPTADGKLIYSPETYFSRGTRGTRTDVVTVYDGATLAPVAEIAIPAKRASNMPAMGNAVLTDDERFLLVFNFNPASSVSVVDTTTRQFIGEVETPGCALIYPTGPRSFFTLCGDGGALVTQLDDKGGVASQTRTQPLFDVDHDPVTEKGVRLGDTWYFVTFAGRIVPFHATRSTVTPGEPWWLTTAAERQQGWRPGGLQQLAVHAGRNRLYSIMHQGTADTHKDPGKAIWAFDVGSHRRVQTIRAPGYVSSIQLSPDATPLLYGAFLEGGDFYVFDGLTGKLRRRIDHLGTTPTLIVTP
jgi:methylamine dehydrogenase heavy chain